MSQEQRLGNDKRTPEERQENARRAGIESGKSRRRKRTMREAAELMLNNPEQEQEYIDLLKAMGCKNQAEMTNLMSIVASMIRKAKSGDVKAANFVKDIVSDSEADKLKKRRLELELQRFEHLRAQSDPESDGVKAWIEAVLDGENTDI